MARKSNTQMNLQLLVSIIMACSSAILQDATTAPHCLVLTTIQAAIGKNVRAVTISSLVVTAIQKRPA